MSTYSPDRNSSGHNKLGVKKSIKKVRIYPKLENMHYTYG